MKAGLITNFKFYFKFLKYRIILALILSVVVGAFDSIGIALFLPLLQMFASEGVQYESNIELLNKILDIIKYLNFEISFESILVFILLIFLLKGVFKFIEEYYKVITKQFFVYSLRVHSIDLFVNFKYTFFNYLDPGRIQNTFSNEILKVSKAFQSYLATLQSISFVILYSFLAFLVNFQFALLLAFGSIIINLFFRIIFKRSKKLSSSLTNESHKFEGLLLQFVSQFKYLKATARLDKYANKLKRSIGIIENDNKKVGLIRSILAAVKEPMIYTLVITVVLIQVNFFDANINAVILSLMFFYRALNYVMISQTTWNSYLTVIASVENFNDVTSILKQNEEVITGDEYDGFNQSLELKNLHFSYSNVKILENININFFKNKTYAIVGESGSGKTTLVNILTGLLQFDQGKYLVDEKNFNEYNRKSFQAKIGYITQESVIFNDTVFNNVTFWEVKNKKSLKKFWIALEKANIHDDIKALEKSEDTMLGMNGVSISGGQRQRISIARELYKEIDLLIMDEATASLDAATELVISDNIKSLKGELTILIVAHRLSTVKHADSIVILEKGKVRVEGDFYSLLKNDHMFKKMVELQGI